MSDTIDTKDTKEAGDMLPAMSADEKMIQDGFNELLQDYLNSNHRRKVERITKAFNFANQAHAGVKRRSGEPYIMHPIAVARIVCREMGLGSTSICSALLHDVVEDTEYTVQDISDMFGPKIAQIVDGLTKISGGIFGEQASAQAENFRKLLLTMSDDIRVILTNSSLTGFALPTCILSTCFALQCHCINAGKQPLSGSRFSGKNIGM